MTVYFAIPSFLKKRKTVYLQFNFFKHPIHNNVDLNSTAQLTLSKKKK